MTFGHALKVLWGLDPEHLFLNHGSFGATPIELLRAQRRWQDRLEARPVHFIVRELPDLLRDQATALAGFVGAEPARLAFVANASTGCNAVLRSLRLEPGDRLVTLDHVYPAVRNLLHFVAERAGAQVEEVPLPCPLDDDAWLEDLDRALVGARVAVLDHLTSATGLCLPIERMVGLCRDRGVPVLVDGAHGPGQVDLDLEALGATWYTGNLHKWLCAPKGSALLWTSEAGSAELHSTTISHGFGQGLAAEFDYPGTLDPSAWLCTQAALRFREERPGWSEYTHGLALRARSLVIEELGLTPAGGSDRVRNMAAFLLPERFGGGLDAQLRLQRALVDRRVEIPITAHGGRLLLRLSAQVYNQIDDYERLVQVLRVLGV